MARATSKKATQAARKTRFAKSTAKTPARAAKSATGATPRRATKAKAKVAKMPASRRTPTTGYRSMTGR